MKRITALILIIITILCGCSEKTAEENEAVSYDDEIRAVWIYFDELSMINENGGNEKSFTEKINVMFDNCAKMNINTVFVQVRPFADSFYPSDIFPWSKYLTGEQGKSAGYDPLKIMVDSAHERSLSLHAWINPFRICYSGGVCDTHPAKKWIDEKNDNVIITENGIFFNPASDQANRLILDGVREIVKNYDVDGIHIDDYFYMSQSAEIDKNDYDKYVLSGGKLELAEWRRQNINSFVSALYNTVKASDGETIVSVSPAGNIYNNYNTLYADVKKWAGEKGYCDWLIPQLYYGFESERLPFDKAADEWAEIRKEKSVKLIAGIAAYKASDEPEGEWADSGIILRQIRYTNNSGYGGYSLFSYSSMMSESFAEYYDSMQALSDDEADGGSGQR